MKKANQLNTSKTVSVPASSAEKPVSIVVDNTGIVMYVGIESGLNWARKPDYLADMDPFLDKSNTQIFQETHSAFKEAASNLRLNPSPQKLLQKLIAEQKYLDSCGNLGIVNEVLQAMSRLLNLISSDREKLLKLLFEVKKLIELNT